MNHTELANDYFERHSSSDECHITSDGRVFHTIGYAMSFSQEHNLKPTTIESYKKDSDTGEITGTESFKPEAEDNHIVEATNMDDNKGLSFEEALKEMNEGALVKLPEWEGFWFKNIKKDEILVFTKDGEILNNPDDSFKSRNDWQLVEASAEQYAVLESYFEASHIVLSQGNVANQVDTYIEAETVENQETTEEVGISDDFMISKLKQTDVSTAEYSDLKSFAKHFKLETADQKADTLKAALTEFKNSLK